MNATVVTKYVSSGMAENFPNWGDWLMTLTGGGGGSEETLLLVSLYFFGKIGGIKPPAPPQHPPSTPPPAPPRTPGSAFPVL